MSGNNDGEEQQQQQQQQIAAIQQAVAQMLSGQSGQSVEESVPREVLEESIRLYQAEEGDRGRPAAPSFLDSDSLREATIDRRILRRMKKLGRETCGVCLSVFEEGHDAAQLECGHWFHTGSGSDMIDEAGTSCLVGWLAKNSTCPTCRFQLPTADESFDTSTREETHDAAPRRLLDLGNDGDDGGPSGSSVPHGIFG